MKAKDITFVAMNIALISILGLLPPTPMAIIPVPIVFQNAGIMLTGILLGKKNGSLAVTLFLFLVALGLPLLSGGRGGVSVFFGPTSGYMISWILAAYFIGSGKLLFRNTKSWMIKFLIVWVPGVILVDFLGSIGLTIVTKINIIESLVSNLIFLPGDSLKAIIVVVIANRLVKLNLFS